MSNLTRNTITSMEVAEMVGKEHSKLLRDIRNYVSQLAEAKIGLGDFFTEATYKDANNQSTAYRSSTGAGVSEGYRTSAE